MRGLPAAARSRDGLSELRGLLVREDMIVVNDGDDGQGSQWVLY